MRKFPRFRSPDFLHGEKCYPIQFCALLPHLTGPSPISLNIALIKFTNPREAPKSTNFKVSLILVLVKRILDP